MGWDVWMCACVCVRLCVWEVGGGGGGFRVLFTTVESGVVWCGAVWCGAVRWWAMKLCAKVQKISKLRAQINTSSTTSRT